MPKLHYRAVFVSDLHLGSNGCRAGELASFLKHIKCDSLYLVGDVIDMWRLRQRWYWPEKHNRVVQRILKMARKGTRVVLVPGNHDEHARPYAGLSFGGVDIKLETLHTTADGRRMLITHGDQFDLVVKHARLLSIIGSWAYDNLVRINHYYNLGRRAIGMPYWSLSQAVKDKVKSACSYVARFEEALLDEAARGGYDGVICGHIHKAQILRADDERPVDYYNCGDWIESCTALVEHDDGTIRLVDGAALVEQLKEQRRSLRAATRKTRSPQDNASPHSAPAAEAAD